MNGKKEFQERLKTAMLGVGLKFEATELIERLSAHAKASGLPNPASRQTIYTWIGGEGKPGVGHLFFLAEALDVSAKWLGTGLGIMTASVDLAAEELDAIKQIYRPLKDDAPTKLLQWLRSGLKEVESSTFASKRNPFAKV